MKTIESVLGILGMTSALAAQVLAQPLNNFTYTTNDNAVTITAFTNWRYSDTVTIPRRINGLPVIRIDSDAFYGCNMTGVVIPMILPKNWTSGLDGALQVKLIH